MASIVADVAAARGVPVSVLRGRGRLKQNVRARQEAIWRCREVRQDGGKPRYTLPQIGQFFKRHHTTIIHACKRHAARTVIEPSPESEPAISLEPSSPSEPKIETEPCDKSAAEAVFKGGVDSTPGVDFTPGVALPSPG